MPGELYDAVTAFRGSGKQQTGQQRNRLPPEADDGVKASSVIVPHKGTDNGCK